MLTGEDFNIVNTPKEFQIASQETLNDPKYHFHGPMVRTVDDQNLIKNFPF